MGNPHAGHFSSRWARWAKILDLALPSVSKSRSGRDGGGDEVNQSQRASRKGQWIQPKPVPTDYNRRLTWSSVEQGQDDHGEISSSESCSGLNGGSSRPNRDNAPGQKSCCMSVEDCLAPPY